MKKALFLCILMSVGFVSNAYACKFRALFIPDEIQPFLEENAPKPEGAFKLVVDEFERDLEYYNQVVSDLCRSKMMVDMPMHPINPDDHIRLEIIQLINKKWSGEKSE